MEELLALLKRDSLKFLHVQKSCQNALEILKSDGRLAAIPVYELRQICLEAFQLSLESHSNKLSSHAVAGIRILLKDERFQSSIESEREDRWLPMQILNTVWSLPSLSEDAQVEIMKVLLNMSFTTLWCMNAKVIIKISQLCLDTLLSCSRQAVRRACSNTVRQSLGVFYQRQLIQRDTHTHNTNLTQVLVDTYPSSSSASVRSASKATMTQMLASFAEKLPNAEHHLVEDKAEDILADFKARDDRALTVESIRQDIVCILKFLISHLVSSWLGGVQTKLVIPLLLEGIHAILHHVPTTLGHYQHFCDLFWQQLCPGLIGLLGNPKAENTLSQKSGNHEDQGRGSGSSIAAPTLPLPSARIVYSISIELVRLVGDNHSLRPVLESLFHRILLFPPPQYRQEALKAVKQLVSRMELLMRVIVPVDDGEKSGSDVKVDIGLLKLFVDSLQECCHCADSSVCITSVECVNLLLGGLEQLCAGEGLSDKMTEQILKLRVHLLQDLAGMKRKQSYSLQTSNPKEQSSPSNVVITLSEVQDTALVGECDPDTNAESCDDKQGNTDHNEGADADTDKVHDAYNHNVKHVDGDNEIPKSQASETSENEDLEEGRHNNTCASPVIDTLHPDTRHHNGMISNIMNDTSDEEFEETSDDSSLQNVHEVIQLQLDEERQLQIQRRAEMFKTDFEKMERQSAQDYGRVLVQFLPSLVNAGSVQKVDEALVQFSSNICQRLCTPQSHGEGEEQSHVILNADGVYMATISVLWLNLKLCLAGFYTNQTTESSIPSISEELSYVNLHSIRQDWFVDSVLGTGMLLFLSPTWLSELYRLVITTDLLTEAGYAPSGEGATTLPLVCFLTDLDGLGSDDTNKQLLCDYQSEEGTVLQTSNKSHIEAGKVLSRFVLTCCWDGILDVLSVLLNGNSSCGITNSLGLMLGIEGAKEESLRAREAICASLEGLQKAARLCCSLGLQGRCGSVFAQLANSSCVIEELAPSPQVDRKAGKTSAPPAKPKLVRLHTAHVLSLDVMMTMGLEMGSHSADCWSHVFRCCAHISELEHKYFTIGSNQTRSTKVLPGQTIDRESDYLSEPVMSVPVAITPQINVPELVKQSSIEGGWDSALTGGGVLSAGQTAKALCGLSQEVDRLFEDAANKLNMGSLLGFLGELCEASQCQLARLGKGEQQQDDNALPTNALHLYRLQDVLMRVKHSGRPLLHLLRAWTVVSPYLAEATGHKDRSVSKMAVSCIHDYITAMVSNTLELPHFHVNELLCKTLETLLCLDLCDGDVQDQVVCSICELVETCTAEIRSGWRPLFAALRAVKIEYTTNEKVNEARQHHVAAVLDVFDVFLGTDNAHVFANAAVDCILCLLKYVRGPGEFQADNDDDSDSGSESGLTGPGTDENLCEPALMYLQKCCTILSSIWNMPACPVFNGAHRIHTADVLALVDAAIPHVDFDDFKRAFADDTDESSDSHIAAGGDAADRPYTPATQPKNNNNANDKNNCDTVSEKTDAKHLTVLEELDLPTSVSGSPQTSLVLVTLEQLDNPTGILHVWFLVLEGLVSAIAVCPKSYQPQTLEMLFGLLRATSDVPELVPILAGRLGGNIDVSEGPQFSLFCMNHLVLPMLQSWLRVCTRVHGYWDGPVANFKQCCGLCTDLIVEFIVLFSDKGTVDDLLNLMLKQLLDVLIECVALPVETISRLGCSCIRHVLLSGGPLLTETMWQISAHGMERAIDMTTYRLRQLMVLFHANSQNFYGDIGQVKVATRRDSTVMECQRLHHLAQQVFLLDSQVSNVTQMSYDLETDKSYVFLLYPPGCESSINPDHILARVPFHSVVVGLLSHQLLLQTLGCVLLQGSSNPGLQDHLQASPSSPTHRATQEGQSGAMPGMLPYLSTRNTLTLLHCLHSSYKVACDFDCRPGLKFLVQKVANTDVAANLYKQAVASMTFYISTLTEISSCYGHLSIERTHEYLTREPAPADHEHQLMDGILCHPDIFTRYLQWVCDDISQTYVELVLDKEGTAAVDRMANKPLFFLIAQPDDMPEFTQEQRWRPLLEARLKQRESRSAFSSPVPLEDQPQVPVVETDELCLEEDPGLSPVRTKSKRASREEQENRVYTVATDRTIRSLMTQYKRRKQHHSMPNFHPPRIHKKPEVKDEKKNSVDAEIEEQQQTSIMKDSEAHLKAWSELLVTTLRLLLHLNDEKFLAIMPTVFNAVNLLVCRAEDTPLREAMGDWLHRLGRQLLLAPRQKKQSPAQESNSPDGEPQR